MHLWDKTFHRIPPERRNGQYKHRSHDELCEDISRAYDHIFWQKLHIWALTVAVAVEGTLIHALWSSLLDCIEAGHKMAALLQ